ncbi:MAG: hypothetical protein GY810_03030 [Aureispira sp.]|nr:hypothetical protein [Aureispira sp.]
MQSKQQQLFYILNSLSANEKAYIKKYGYKNNKKESPIFYLLGLIDKAIKTQTIQELDEEKLKNKLTKRHPNQDYIKLKSRLFQLVLESLQAYDHNNDLQKLYDLMAQVESLRRRNFHQAAYDTLKKAQKQASALEEMGLLAEIQLQMQVTNSFITKHKKEDILVLDTGALDKTVEHLKEKINTTMAALSVVAYQKTIGNPRSKEDLSILKRLEELPTFQSVEQLQLYSTKIDRAIALAAIYIAKGAVGKAVELCSFTINELNIPNKTQRALAKKLITLFDILMQACLMTIQLDLYEEYYAKFLLLNTYGQHEKLLKSGVDLTASCMYSILSNQIEKYTLLDQQFEKIKTEKYIPNYRKVSICYYLIFGNFMLEDYKRAYARLLWLYQQKELAIRYDVDIALKTMELIMLYEAEEYYYLGLKLRTLSNLLKKNNRKFKLEQSLIQLISKTLKIRSKLDFKTLLEQSYAEMGLIIQQHPEEKQFLNAFDILSWIESQLTAPSFRTVYYENNIKQ